jgi:hypothetical protein
MRRAASIRRGLNRRTSMSGYGIEVKGGTGGKRIELACEHQSGLLYAVPGEASWVCSPELLHVHALAGFFRELEELDIPQVRDAMQRWGLYYRSRALSSHGQGDD